MFALRFEYLDGVGLFAIGIASLKPQNLQIMTLITQHKPIERSTDMVFMTKQCWSFYRFMLRDKHHDLQVLRFEAGSTNSKQTQLSQLLQRHTVPTYPWHLFDWTFSFYIVHLCLTFQTVGVQNPKHDWVQLPCCRHNTWKQWDNTWMLGKWFHCWFVLKLDNVLVVTAH